MSAHLERIAAVNPALNAIVTLDAEGALAAARAADGSAKRAVMRSDPCTDFPLRTRTSS